MDIYSLSSGNKNTDRCMTDVRTDGWTHTRHQYETIIPHHYHVAAIKLFKTGFILFLLFFMQKKRCKMYQTTLSIGLPPASPV